jgi:hypothetical protein
MTENELLQAILQHVKSNPKCNLSQNEKDFPNTVNGIKWHVIRECVESAIEQHLLKGHYASQGYMFLEITTTGDQLLK